MAGLDCKKARLASGEVLTGLELNARPSAPLDDPATIRREMREQRRDKDENP